MYLCNESEFWLLKASIKPKLNFGFIAFISHKGQMIITYPKRFYKRKFFAVMLWLWILSPSKCLAYLKLNIGLFGLYWLHKQNLNSLFRAPISESFALSIWFGYYKRFLRTFECYADTNKHKSICKYSFDMYSRGPLLLDGYLITPM